MAHVSSSDSSDSETEVQKLKEAAIDVGHIIGFQQLCHSTKEKSSQRKQECVRSEKQSLRSPLNDDKQKDDDINITPELKNFIAKKLSDIVDSQIDIKNDSNISKDTVADEDEDSDGIKLLASSRSNLLSCLPKAIEQPKHLKVRKKRKKNLSTSSSDSDDVNDQLTSVAVTGEFILSEAKLSAEISKSKFELEANTLTDENLPIQNEHLNKTVIASKEKNSSVNSHEMNEVPNICDNITNSVSQMDTQSRSEAKKKHKKSKKKRIKNNSE